MKDASAPRLKRSAGRAARGPDRRELGAIFVGAFAGAIARGLLTKALPYAPAKWPWATFAVNVAGTALLAWVLARPRERPSPSAYRRPLLGTGFCGALTTFSTMQLELVWMLDAGRYTLAASYSLLSLLVGLGATHLVTRLSRRSWVPA